MQITKINSNIITFNLKTSKALQWILDENKIHVDTANLKDIKNYSKIKYIKGITTNPS